MIRGALVLTGIPTVLVGALLPRRGLGGWDPDGGLGDLTDPDTLAAGSAAAAVVAGLLALSGVRTLRVAGTVLATLGIVGTVAALVGAVGTGLPGPSSAVLAVGSLAVGLAGLGGGFVDGARPAPATPRRRRVAVGGVAVLGAALLVVGAALAAVPAVVGSTVVATTADPVPAAAVPDRPSAVAWRWSGTDGVRQVEAAGPGVVVAGNEGVTALDGTTGTVRWAFSRTGAPLRTLATSPDGGSVLAVHSAGEGGASGAGVLTVLDATTGERRWEAPLEQTGLDDGLITTPEVVVTSSVLPRDTEDTEDTEAPLRVRYEARDLRSGTTSWAWDSPGTCDAATNIYPLRTVRAVPVPVACGGRSLLTGLDDRTGREVWSADLGATERPDGSVVSTADGTLVALVGRSPTLLLDSRSGAVRSTVPTASGFPVLGRGAPRLEVGSATERTLTEVALDLPSGTGRPLPPAPCPSPSAVVAAVTVQVCRPEGPEASSTVTVGDAPPVPLGTLATSGVLLDGTLGAREPVVVPAPGAWVVAGTGRAVGSVVGLR